MEQGYQYKRDGKDGGYVYDEEEMLGAVANVSIDDYFYPTETWTSTEDEDDDQLAILLSEGKVTSPQKLKIISTLIQMGFNEENSVIAASKYDTLDDCIDYMQTKCPMCLHLFATNKMVDMLRCRHKVCKKCAYQHFKPVITSSIVDLRKAVCPVCLGPNLADVNTCRKYLDDLDLLIYKLFTKKEYDTFCRERKKYAAGDSSSNQFILSVKRFTPATQTIKRDDLVAKLLKLDFKAAEARLAAECCDTLEACLVFLKQECKICLETSNAHNMFQMLNCTHSCCRNCAKEYFTLKITEQNITEMVCIACNQPDILKEDREVVFEYFSNMDIVLKGLIEEETHELFQRKLRDWTLNKDLNFRWCGKCDFGFIMEPRSIATCPKCNYATCSNCKKPWEPQHNRMTCVEFARWKSEGEQQEGLTNYLDKYGIECPMCHHKYVLVKGGCLHFTCSQCRHEFCYGCDRPFYHGANCKVSTECTSMGIHAHHPRNCSFYLRDIDYRVLEQLLKAHGVDIGESALVRVGVQNKCIVMVQNEGEAKDHECGMRTEYGRSRCPVHYVEYLCGLIKKSKVDSVSILDEKGLTTVLRRAGLPVLLKGVHEQEHVYRERLINFVRVKIPL